MSPGEELKKFISSYVDDNKLDEHLKTEVPKKWEKYGDFVLFDDRTFCSDVWKCQGSGFWQNIAEILKCKRLGAKDKIKSDGFRSPNVSILLGDDPWITHKDNGIKYTWHVQKNMFSAGNTSERQRIGKLACTGEVVVDLFAGIGYFTLPLIIHAKAKFVHACEWNPVACDALQKNLKLNGVQDKCIIHNGDNRLVCPKKIANRVNLGLIPSTENYWGIACEALTEKGGMLHVHENVETKKFELNCQNCEILIHKVDVTACWKNICLNSTNYILECGDININWKYKQWIVKGVHLLHSLITILTKMDHTKTWFCDIQHLSHVKSYAPNVHHLVYDVKIWTLPPAFE